MRRRAMMRGHHPRGAPAHPGKSLKYWVETERHGRLGGMSFHAAGWHEHSRDAHIGWSARARAANLGLVLNHSRLLILPRARVFGLASRALGLALGRVGEDWRSRYGVRPALVYTYVDRARSGRCYGEAGFERVGLTSGRMSPRGEAKKLFVAPLGADWRERLRRHEPARFRTLSHPPVDGRAGWSDLEFGASTHPDGRVRQRIARMGRAWQREPGEPVSRIFVGDAECKAAYRLLSSGQVNMDDILEAHRQATVRRCAARPVVLAVQDASGLNCDTLKRSTRGLTSIGGTAKGIYAHASLALAENGRPLGVLDIDGEFRAACAERGEVTESMRWSEGLATALELSQACGEGTRVISAGDREADIWEVFELQARHRQARVAKVLLRVAKVQLQAPGRRSGTLPMTAVSVKEDRPPAGVKEPLNWLLVSSEGEADARSADRIRQWYEKRWSIEEFFRVLKTGTRIEDRRFDQAADLLKCLAFDAVAAWRVLDLQRVARREPDRLASELFDPDELAIVQMKTHRLGRRSQPIRPPPDLTAAQFTVNLGRLAGFRPAKKQPLPGTLILWNASKRLMAAKQTIEEHKKFWNAETSSYQSPVSSMVK